MYVYMIRSQADPVIKDKVVNYMLTEHFPYLMQTGCFVKCSLEIDSGTNEIISRYECESELYLTEYLEKHSGSLRREMLSKFPHGVKTLGRSFSKMLLHETLSTSTIN